MVKNPISYPVLATVLFIFWSCSAQAQFPYSETFKNSTAPGLIISGAAKLTAAASIDPLGQGYLRLTENTMNSVGYMYAQQSFPSNYGLTASFEFFTWKPDATTAADGISFFLFDASVNAFRPGGSGGSLGYAQYYGTPGMAKGYMGISVDEFGNFSNASDGGKNGGPGKRPSSIAIRGPGDGRAASDYVYQTGVTTTDASYNATFLGFTQRYFDPTSANYRKIEIILTPGSTLGVNIGYKITVVIYKGGSTLTPVTLISNFDYPFAAPARLQYGLASSTGSISSYHEIRNVNIDVTNTTTLVPPTTANDNGTIVCQDQQALSDVTANDVCNNTGGSINKATVDLDPSTAGKQTTFTDDGKGTFTVDQNGIVTFIPVIGFSGNSLISYKVDDTYGITSSASSTITIIVNSAAGPSLTVTNPAAVCSPQTIDITSASYKSNTTDGATYDYFSNLTNANSNVSNINATASNISVSGTYYIRATFSGCPTIKPIVVQISQAPSASNAGSNLPYCGSNGMQSFTLLGNNPNVGTGTWTQVNGPVTAAIAYPNSATSPASTIEKGVYVFRWSISNGACPVSASNVQISVGTINSVAGSNQNLCTATTTTLQGNTPLPGIGTWSQLSGPAISINNPSNPSSTVSGLNAGSTYVLSWSITNGACTNASQVSISNYETPVANAGPNQSFSNATTATLGAASPAIGSGIWTQVSGPAATITTPGSPSSTLSSLIAGNIYILRWTVTNGSCLSFNDVTLTNVLNTVAYAGPDQVVGNVTIITLNGNTPDAGNTGLWTLVSAPPGSTAVINQPGNPATTVDMINRDGDYIFNWAMTNGSFSNTDEMILSVSRVLPVKFVFFSGTLEKEYVTLSWQTASENNNNHFNVERSFDGIQFTAIGLIPGAGMSSLSHNYVYHDNVKGLITPVLYYRLQQVDNDGKSSYSQVLKIVVNKINNKEELSIWPNPFKDRIHIRAYYNTAGIARISIYDNTGRLIQLTDQQVIQGYNYIDIDYLQKINPGFIILEVAKDQFIHRQKLIKN